MRSALRGSVTRRAAYRCPTLPDARQGRALCSATSGAGSARSGSTQARAAVPSAGQRFSQCPCGPLTPAGRAALHWAGTDTLTQQLRAAA